MYEVSQAYKTQMKRNVQQRKLRGTINEVVSFTDDDILQGSFTLTNQCMDSSAFGYGGVYIAELHLTFVTERVYDRKKWKGKRLFIEDGLYIDSEGEYEYIPLGHFRVAEANYTTWGLEITAYDLMSQFDHDYWAVQTDGAPYDLASLACRECGVTMHQNRTAFNKVASFPSSVLLVKPEGIETWRDFLSYLCQACNMYCTMARDGSLDFRKIEPANDSTVDDPTDTITIDDRFDDGVISDFTTSYTGIQATFASGDEAVTKTYGSDKGVVIDFGANPMLQEVADNDTTAIIGKLQNDIESTGEAIEEMASRIEALEAQIELVKQEIHDHPEDKSLPKLLEQLEKELESKKNGKEELEGYKADLEATLEKVEQGLIDHSIDILGARLSALAVDLQSIQYTPATFSMLGDPCYDLGDVLRVTGGIAGGECDINVMRYDYTFGSRYTVETFGERPTSNDAKSKDAKSSAQDKGQAAGSKIDFVKFINASEIIARAESLDNELVRMKFGVKTKCDVEEWTEIKLRTKGRTRVKFHYWLDGEDIPGYTVEETFTASGLSAHWDGSIAVFTPIADPNGEVHTVNYHYHLNDISPDSYHSWIVVMDVLEGEAHIETGDIHTVLWSQGMIGGGNWKGFIEAADAYPLYPIKGMNIGVGTVAENVRIIGVIGAEFNVTTEDGDNLITEDGDNLITE